MGSCGCTVKRASMDTVVLITFSWLMSCVI